MSDYSPAEATRLAVQRVAGRSYDEVCVRGRVPAGAPVRLDALLDAARAAVPGLAPTHATLAGPRGWRRDEHDRAELPCVCLTQGGEGPAGGEAPAGGDVAVEIKGLVSRPGCALTLERPAPGVTVASCRDAGATLRRAWIAGARSGPAPTAVGDLFEGFDATLRTLRISPHHLTRTWFYLDRIADTYDDLNAARDAWFDRWRLPALPASTGVGADLGGAAVAALLETTSVDGRNPAREVAARMQCSPTAYGPRFARANTWTMNGLQHLNVSGISSIDEHGRSLARSADTSAIDFAMRSAAELLEQAGGFAFADVVSARAYATPETATRAFAHYRAEAAGLTDDCLELSAWICRPELTFEFEATALRAWDDAGDGAGAR